MLIEFELLIKGDWIKLEFNIDRDRLKVVALSARDCQSEAFILQVVQVERAFVIHEACDDNLIIKETLWEPEKLNNPLVSRSDGLR